MTPYHERYLREKGIGNPFVRVPHGVDLDTFTPDGGESVRDDLGVGDRLAVGIVGSFNRSEVHGTVYGWTLLEALADDALADAPVVGVLIGGGDDLDYIEEKVADLGIEDRVVTTGRVPHEEIPDYIAALDVSLLVKTDHPADKMTTTMKLPEYLAAGTYPLVDANTYAATVLDDSSVSVLEYDGIRDPEFPGRLAEELAALVADRERVRAGGEYARSVAEERFDYDRIRADLRADLAPYL
jgi:glycosyltransferase involved in cell wall biosynthesis